jgi:deoxycytidine triphosphate deaminase
VFEKTETLKKPIRTLTIEAKGIKANGYEDAKGFVVMKGSQLVKEEVPSIHQYLSTLRKDLLAQGVILDNGSHYVFTQDKVFQSPSTAAGVIQGRSAIGRLDWRNSEGKSLKQLQEEAAGGDSKP